MIYNPKKPVDVKRATDKLLYFIQTGKPFEMKLLPEIKTLKQNNYFHLIVGWFAFEYGDTTEHVKQYLIKKIVCAEIFKTEFTNKLTGEIREDYKSFASISKQETTYVINKFRDYASKQAGIYLPAPEEKDFLKEIEVQLKNNQQYL